MTVDLSQLCESLSIIYDNAYTDGEINYELRKCRLQNGVFFSDLKKDADVPYLSYIAISTPLSNSFGTVLNQQNTNLSWFIECLVIPANAQGNGSKASMSFSLAHRLGDGPKFDDYTFPDRYENSVRLCVQP